MIPELGHYALMLALGLALIQGIMPIVGTRTNDAVLIEHGRADGAGAVRVCRDLVRGARRILRHLGLLGAQCLREFEFGDAADLPAHQRVGQPRRLHDAVGLHPRFFRCFGGGLRQQFAGDAQSQRARRAGLDRRGVPAFHSHDVQSVRAHSRRAVRGPRSQSDPPGSRPRLPSADALSRLCRVFDRLFVRHCSPARRPHRRGVGALGAARGCSAPGCV